MFFIPFVDLDEKYKIPTIIMLVINKNIITEVAFNSIFLDVNKLIKAVNKPIIAVEPTIIVVCNLAIFLWYCKSK